MVNTNSFAGIFSDRGNLRLVRSWRCWCATVPKQSTVPRAMSHQQTRQFQLSHELSCLQAGTGSGDVPALQSSPSAPGTRFGLIDFVIARLIEQLQQHYQEKVWGLGRGVEGELEQGKEQNGFFPFS